jgi:glyoxylase-like metal-dependent hydrolase (beta-lactamase superfamily II)
MFQLQSFYDPATFTLSYVVFDPNSRDAVVIDPVLDYDPLGSSTSTASAEKLDAFVLAQRLRIHYVLETHAHADHLSGSAWLKTRHPDLKVAIGARITDVQETFRGVFDLPPSFPVDGSQFDALLADGQTIEAGTLRIKALGTPGHTPACMSFVIDDAVFTGDALFIEDYGTGRCDFPKGSASDLYTSVHDKLYALPDTTRVFVGHDYQPGGRELRCETTIGASKERNVQLRQGTSREEFVQKRQSRDATLAAPRLLFPSVQVNIDAGRLPEASGNGMRYLRVPLNMRKKTRRDGSPDT